MKDYTLLARSIQETMKTIGAPLNEDQYLILSGSLSAMMLSIESIGIDQVLNNIENKLVNLK